MELMRILGGVALKHLCLVQKMFDQTAGIWRSHPIFDVTSHVTLNKPLKLCAEMGK